MEDYRKALETAPDNKAEEAAYEVLLADQKAAEKAYVASYTEINSRERNTETIFKKILQSDKSKQMIDAVENLTTSVLGTIFWGGKK